MRWLVTGGCGFIGRNLVDNLVDEEGHFIRIIDNLKVGSRKDLSMVCDFTEITPEKVVLPSSNTDVVELIVDDILNRNLALKLCKGFDIIVHLAANTGVESSVINPSMDCEVNVFGTMNYLEAARLCGIDRFVFASSGAPAGEVEPPIHEELPPHPVSPYGASKLAGEGYCSSYFHTFGVDTVCLRFGNVYGPFSGKKDSVVAKFIKKALAGEILEIYGDGRQTRDFIYVKDMINAIRAVAVKPGIGGEIFQIATSKETTVSELLRMLTKILIDSGVETINYINSDPRPGDVKHNYADTSKAKDQLGWQAQTKLEEGLKKTIKWFLDI